MITEILNFQIKAEEVDENKQTEEISLKKEKDWF